ncbi:MAG: glycosyltransferase family 2 protein [Actinobacteria bacterium]|nr:glycosyltransferase family 2 protein [Actinomycetota bacterium]
MTSTRVGRAEDGEVWYRIRLPGEPPAEAQLTAAATAALSVPNATELRVHERGRSRLARLRAQSPPFVETPPSLIDSWHVARHLDRKTRPGDALVVSDRAGLAGMFVLDQRVRPVTERRTVVIVAGCGTGLRLLAIAGTCTASSEREHEIDWEMVAYRWADAVLTFSAEAAGRLADQGVQAISVRPGGQDVGHPPPRTPAAVWLPEPVSRLSRSAEILRALSALDVEELRVFVSSEDRDDDIWHGTTWHALAGVRAGITGRIERTEDPPAADLIVLGDPYRLPDERVAEARAAGTPVIVAAQSAASSVWPTAPAWRDEDELLALVDPPRSERATSRPGTPTAAAPHQRIELQPPRPAPHRASRVSVAVPVFRDVTFLDDAVRSVVAQAHAAYELLLVDDGSRSLQVDAALERWAEELPGLVRVLRQPNRGVSAARNLALEHMTGDAFVFVDQDDELRPTFLSRCAEALRANPDMTAVATWTEFFGAYAGVEAKPPFDARVGMRENPIVSTCVLVDMAVRDAGIRFDRELAWIYCEDWDFWSRIVAAGGRFGLVPEPLARHRVHPTSGGHQRTPLALALGRARATSHLRCIEPGGPLTR